MLGGSASYGLRQHGTLAWTFRFLLECSLCNHVVRKGPFCEMYLFQRFAVGTCDYIGPFGGCGWHPEIMYPSPLAFSESESIFLRSWRFAVSCSLYITDHLTIHLSDLQAFSQHSICFYLNGNHNQAKVPGPTTRQSMLYV